jgi:U3 small nucleolar RNA-associated protein 13
LAVFLQLFSGSADATVRVWDLLAKAVSEDGWTLLTAGRDKVHLS